MNEPLWDAIWREDVEEVRCHLEQPLDLNLQASNGYTALMQATEMENIEIAELLIFKGAVINGQGYEGATPLHIAVDISIDGTIQNGGELGEEPIGFISFLLKNGADQSIKDKNGKTALDWAISYKPKKIIGLLTSANT